MIEKVLSSGAEAVIYKIGNFVTKSRVPKNYRIKELDDKIRKSRTKSEAKILKKAKEVVLTPTVLSIDENKKEIKMDFIEGKKLSESLNEFNLKEQKVISKKIGEGVGKLHREGIIHGDLTTSNLIYLDKKIYFIDFGLSYLNGKYEDKAVDLHLLRQALEAKHFTYWKELFEEVKRGYLEIDKIEGEKVLERLKAVERRGRYKH
jgi:TP53 regulating kinase-like protein